MIKAERYKKFIAYFDEHRPIADTELIYQTPFELLVAVILSAQCTDKRVNKTTPELFTRYPNPQKMADSSYEEVFDYIRSISYPNSKSKYLVNMSRMLINDFKGQIPDNTDDLQKLPGVGRKTANVIAAVIFNLPTMAVDTHVFRVSARIGLSTNAKTPLETEKQLLAYIPENKRNLAHHWLILHGRYVCLARKPKCKECGLTAICKYFSRKK